MGGRFRRASSQAGRPDRAASVAVPAIIAYPAHGKVRTEFCLERGSKSAKCDFVILTTAEEIPSLPAAR